MDSFEAVVAAILQRQGYWTQTSFKVELTKAEKAEVGRPSMPRHELDVIAYRGKDNALLVVECKSFLDSNGVSVDAFTGKNKKARHRYKLFFDDELRRTVFSRLRKQLVSNGFCARRPRMQLCLAAGKVHGDEMLLKAFFKRKRWRLFTPADLRLELDALSQSGYENSVAAVVSKMLLRIQPR